MEFISWLVTNWIKFLIAIFVITFVVALISNIIYALKDVKDGEYSSEKSKRKKAKKAQEKLEKTKEKAGADFEKETAAVLGKVFGSRAYRNVLIPMENGKETELDMAFVTPKGVIVTECKERGRGSYRPTDDGTMMLLENGMWAYAAPNDLANAEPMPNPLDQNEHHLEELKNFLAQRKVAFNGINLVAVNTRFSLPQWERDLTSQNTDGFLVFPSRKDSAIVRITDDQPKARKKIKEWYDSLPDVYSQIQMIVIGALLENREADEAALMAHKARVAAEENQRKEEERREWVRQAEASRRNIW